MKKFSIYCLFICLFGFVSGCDDSEVAPTMTSSKEVDVSDAKKPTTTTNILKDMLVTGTLPDGRTLEGKVTITEMRYDNTKGLVVDGFIKGDVIAADGTETDVKQSFTNIEATLASGTTAAAGLITTQQSCQILFLELGPIFLDLLGLQLDLSQIVLDLTAVGGEGNLLGNLLCAVAGLLDPNTGLLNLLDDLLQLIELLNQINAII